MKDEETARLFLIKWQLEMMMLLMKETWWWNRDVEKVVAIAKRKVCHKAWRKSKSAVDKHTLDVAKKEVYTAVLAVQVTRIHC